MITQSSEIDYSKGTGFGSISLECDGVAALEALLVKIKLNEFEKDEEPQISGKVAIEVIDTSSGGMRSKFVINFVFKEV